MIFAAMFGGLLCKVLGHRDRRLHVGEKFADGYGMPEPPSAFRICARCGRVRAVKQRKKNEEAK